MERPAWSDPRGATPVEQPAWSDPRGAARVERPSWSGTLTHPLPGTFLTLVLVVEKNSTMAPPLLSENATHDGVLQHISAAFSAQAGAYGVAHPCDLL